MSKEELDTIFSTLPVLADEGEALIAVVEEIKRHAKRDGWNEAIASARVMSKVNPYEDEVEGW